MTLQSQSTKLPFIIAGPCAMESESLCLEVAKTLSHICDQHGFEYIFKSSFDKANRTSVDSYRGPGLDKGLDILKSVKRVTAKVLTDIHTPQQAEAVGHVVDIVQIPAFLCRQTDLLIAAAKTGKVVNVKKAQFLSAQKMKYVIDKIKSTGNSNIMLTERGTMMGTDDLIVDFRNIIEMKKFNVPVVMDCTHSCQRYSPGEITSGSSYFAPYFALSGVIFGASGLFFEVHPDPSKGLSDSSNMIDYRVFEETLVKVKGLKNENIC